jgi:hypothetical protein
MNFPAFDFPPGPGHEFRGAPVYLEPMMGSGERLAIAAAVTGQSMYAVEGLVRPETAECLYGAKAPAFLGLVEAITRSLHDHIEHNRALSEWAPPMTGVAIGEVRSIRAHNATQALAAVAQLHASLCYLPALASAEDEPTESRTDTTLTAWTRDVQERTASRLPAGALEFNVRVPVAPGDIVVVPLVRQRRATFIGLISPVQLTQRVRDAKYKLWNLHLLAQRYDQRELLLGVPSPEAPDLSDQKTRERVFGSIAALKAEAGQSDILIHTAETADQAAELLAA